MIGAEASLSCGIHYVAKWKPGTEPKDRKWPDTVDFVKGRGVYMEELESLLDSEGIKPVWIGVPGVSMKKAFPEMFEEMLKKIEKLKTLLLIDDFIQTIPILFHIILWFHTEDTYKQVTPV